MTWGVGRTRPGVMGCGFVLLLGAVLLGVAAIRSWQAGEPVVDYAIVAAVCAGASIIFITFGRRMTRRPMS